MEKGLISEALMLYREARKIWDVLPFGAQVFLPAAKEAFDKNPKDDKALFVILISNSINSTDFSEQVF